MLDHLKISKKWAEVGIINSFYDLLNMEVTTRTRIGHNTHEKDDMLTYGGTSMDSFDIVASQLMYIWEHYSGICR